jgi:CRISPR-associated endonuclease Csn1
MGRAITAQVHCLSSTLLYLLRQGVPLALCLKYTLALDLGSASCGWAVVEIGDDDDPVRLTAAGVRIFDPGVVGGESKIHDGKDSSKASERRLARQTRRQTYRRALRQRQLFRLLQQHQLLPQSIDGGKRSSEQRHKILNALDERLTLAWRGKYTLPDSSLDLADQSLVYMLRAAAVKDKVEPEALGRILYHLAQRRGYWSNRLDTSEEEVHSGASDTGEPAPESKKKRKTTEDPSEKNPGQVAKGISSLRAEMDSVGTRFPGTYFAMINPHDKGLRDGIRKGIRGRWTERSMFVEEFEAIWTAQKKFYPGILTEELEAKIRYWLFFQRPLSPANHLVGFCELEKGERRAPWATLEAQKFRLLQKVNDLRLIEGGREISLQKAERAQVLEYLETKGDLTFTGLKKLLGRASIQGFNLERGLKDKVEGNRVNVAMLAVFGERWNVMALDEKHTAVEQWRTIRTPEKLETVARERWQLDESSAQRWARGANPPKDYCRLSRKALTAVLPLMEKGVAFKTVEREIYGPRHSGAEPMKLVPKVVEYLPAINNPAVLRALTEMRKVVNAIIREYGKPYQIRIELARELRKNRKERESQTFDAKERQTKREKAARQLLAKNNKQNPSADDIRNVPQYMIDKWLLAEECHWCCPYTGEQINYEKLFVRPEFEVEHIIPLSRCTDNSFGNKTLCHRDENQRKGGNTPWMAYHADEDRWAQILIRVSKFANGPRIGEHYKLRRFKLRTEEELDGFTKRQLTDTRYTSKLAARLLMALYGGRDTTTNADEDTAEFYDKVGRRIFASTGGVTHLLRDAWMLHPNVVLGLGDDVGKRRGKDRSDHRHHAVDALVIALTTEKQVREINLHARTKQGQKWPLDYRDLVRGLKSPWKNRDEFLGDVFQRMCVSHKPEHKLGGKLHMETNYGRERGKNDKGKPILHQRLPIAIGLNPVDIGCIVDKNVREAVQTFANAIGGFKNWSVEKHGYPFLKAHNDAQMPIKRVRIAWEGKNALAIGATTDLRQSKLDNQRRVDSSAKHHVAVFVSRMPTGRSKKPAERWVSDCVSLMEAHQRHRKGLPVVRKTHSKDPEAEFLFSLQKNDIVELETDKGKRYFILASIEADGRLNLFPIEAGGKREDQGSVKVREMANGLKEMKAKKADIDLLGNAHYVNEAAA